MSDAASEVYGLGERAVARNYTMDETFCDVPLATVTRAMSENTELIPFHCCHEWTGGRDANGYPRLDLWSPKRRRTSLLRPQRVAWTLQHGPISGRMRVVPSCLNRSCVNPEHLIISKSQLRQLTRPYPITPAVERFFRYATLGEEDQCWPWHGSTDRHGYGVLGGGRRSDKRIMAHRLSYIMIHGSVGPGLCVLHHCDNPLCVNPSHLYAGTKKDNSADAVRRERCVKISWNTVRDIRAAFGEWSGTKTELARRFGISRTYLSCLVRGSSRRIELDPLVPR